MKKIGYFILILLLGTSCATQKRCYEKWSMKPDTVKTIITRDSIVHRDTTIYIHLPGSTRIDSVLIPCPPPPPEYVPDTARAECPLATAKAWFSYPMIKLQLVQRDTTIKQRLENAITEAFYWKTEYDSIKQVLKEKYVPKFYQFCTFGFLGIVIALIAYIALKIFK